MSKMQRGLLVLVIGMALWFCPVPTGLKLAAWHLFAIFVAVIAGFILQPMPIGAIAFIGITFTALSGILKPEEVLSGFSGDTIWLIVAAFLFAKAFTKSGLGRRIAYLLIKRIGDSTLKIGYTLALTEFIISPATPSNTARGAGIVYPIARSLASAFNSEPGASANRVGAYLMQVGYQSNIITSGMFMTSMAANPLISLLAAQALHIQLTWGMWAAAAIVPGFLSLLIIPYFLYKVYPPEVTHTPEAKALAEDALQSMGKMTFAEKVVAVVFVGALLLWGTAQYTELNATIVAMLAVSVMLMANVLEWKDVLEEKGAWDTFIWMGSLISLADYLSKLGFIPWLAQVVGTSLQGISWVPVFLILVAIYMYAQYGFASMTAHVVSMYSALVSVAAAAGAPPFLAALSLAYASSLCGSLTHYAAGPAPIYFGAGYIEQGKWWQQGFIVSIINLIIWIGIGSMWWKVLGLW